MVHVVTHFAGFTSKRRVAWKVGYRQALRHSRKSYHAARRLETATLNAAAAKNASLKVCIKKGK